MSSKLIQNKDLLINDINMLYKESEAHLKISSAILQLIEINGFAELLPIAKHNVDKTITNIQLLNQMVNRSGRAVVIHMNAKN